MKGFRGSWAYRVGYWDEAASRTFVVPTLCPGYVQGLVENPQLIFNNNGLLTDCFQRVIILKMFPEECGRSIGTIKLRYRFQPRNPDDKISCYVTSAPTIQFECFLSRDREIDKGILYTYLHWIGDNYFEHRYFRSTLLILLHNYHPKQVPLFLRITCYIPYGIHKIKFYYRFELLGIYRNTGDTHLHEL